MEGIVYVLTNEAMPDIVKIGFTTRQEVKLRMQELFSTGVPVPFDCAYAALVQECRRVERALQIAFGPQRLNPKREFFTIEPEQAIEVIKLLELQNLTPDVKEDLNSTLDQDAISSKEKMRKKRPRFMFGEMGIPIGAILTSVSGDVSCEVIADRLVRFKGEEMSLSQATRLHMDLDYNVAPCPKWNYEDKNLGDLYNQTYDLT